MLYNASVSLQFHSLLGITKYTLDTSVHRMPSSTRFQQKNSKDH